MLALSIRTDNQVRKNQFWPFTLFNTRFQQNSTTTTPVLFSNPDIEWHYNMLNNFCNIPRNIFNKIYYTFKFHRLLSFTLKHSSSSYHCTVLEDPQGVQRNYKIQPQSLFVCLHSDIIYVNHQHLWHPWICELYHSLHSLVVVFNSLKFLHSRFP